MKLKLLQFTLVVTVFYNSHAYSGNLTDLRQHYFGAIDFKEGYLLIKFRSSGERFLYNKIQKNHANQKLSDYNEEIKLNNGDILTLSGPEDNITIESYNERNVQQQEFYPSGLDFIRPKYYMYWQFDANRRTLVVKRHSYIFLVNDEKERKDAYDRIKAELEWRKEVRVDLLSDSIDVTVNELVLWKKILLYIVDPICKKSPSWCNWTR